MMVQANYVGPSQAAGSSNIGYGADVGLGDQSTGSMSEESPNMPGACVCVCLGGGVG